MVRVHPVPISCGPPQRSYLGISVHHFVIFLATKEPQGVPKTDADQNDLQELEL